MKTMKQGIAWLLLIPCLATPALADEHARHRKGDHDRNHHEAWEWRGDIHHFHEHDTNRWRSGRWYNGRHDGRLGWWWIVGSLWYFYPVRVEPYPDPYQPPILVAPPSPTPPQYWYYCADPAGYYPYVPQCRGYWQRVPATLPPAPPPG